MYENSRVRNDNSPLLEFEEELRKVRSDIPLNQNGDPVVPGLFDPHRSNIIAPDHLLSGVSKDILNLCFASLPSGEYRDRMSALICNALVENGLPRQRSVYSVSKNSLHNMRLSDVFCVLTMAVGVYRNFVLQLAGEGGIPPLILRALLCLQGLVGLTY